MMTTKLESKWWFIGAASALAAFAAAYLMESAGIAHPSSLSQWIIYGLCFGTLQRGFSFLGWLLAVWISPPGKLLERAR